MAKQDRVGSSNHRRIEHLIKHNSFVQSLYRHGMSAVFRIWGKFIKTDESLVLINGHGYKYNDSSRAIFLKMRELGLTDKLRVVWALNEPDKFEIPGCEKVKMDTLSYFKTAMRAKYWISCVNIERGLHFKKKKQIYLNTWHGAAINVCGNGVKGRSDFHWNYVDYFCVCGKCDERYYGKDFELDPKSYLKIGLPRNDSLFEATAETRQEIRRRLGLPEGKKVILYAPTWRDSEDGGATYQLAPPIDWDRWRRDLGEEYTVMLRTHPYTTSLMNVQFNDFVRNYTDYPDVNDLLIAADILISDYSCILLDYSLLEKPMLCFGYDYDAYKKVRPFYYELEDELPNGVMRTEDEILSYLKTLDYKAESKKTAEFRARHCEYGKGNAAIACIRAVFGSRFSEDIG